MHGANISQAYAEELKKEGFDIYISPSTGHWVRTDNVPDNVYTYQVHKTGMAREDIPDDAFGA